MRRALKAEMGCPASLGSAGKTEPLVVLVCREVTEEREVQAAAEYPASLAAKEATEVQAAPAARTGEAEAVEPAVLELKAEVEMAGTAGTAASVGARLAT